MKQILLDDTEIADRLYPFAAVRHVSGIRIGILTIREKWQRLWDGPVGLKQPGPTDPAGITVPANIIPTRSLVNVLAQTGELPSPLPEDVLVLNHPWDIFLLNDRAIRADFELITAGRASQPMQESIQVTGAAGIFIEEGARLSHCMLNGVTGPIYIGRNAEVMEGSLIRGPFVLGEGSVVKMGARIYGATTIGPNCVAGGEIKNSVLFGHSNKAHDGYLGDSVIAEWCNLGAGTSNSNLKNTAGEVKVWDHHTKNYTGAGQKCGLLMGDYSRAAINSAFNTGTVVGICCNVFGHGLSPKHIPDFTWGDHTLPKYEFEKALRDIDNWKKLKNQKLSDNEIQHLKTIFETL